MGGREIAGDRIRDVVTAAAERGVALEERLLPEMEVGCLGVGVGTESRDVLGRRRAPLEQRDQRVAGERLVGAGGGAATARDAGARVARDAGVGVAGRAGRAECGEVRRLRADRGRLGVVGSRQAMTQMARHAVGVVVDQRRAVGRHRAALDPALGDVAADAGVAHARVILLGDGERRPHQRVATRVGHHAPAPVVVDPGVGAAEVVVALRAGLALVPSAAARPGRAARARGRRRSRAAASRAGSPRSAAARARRGRRRAAARPAAASSPAATSTQTNQPGRSVVPAQLGRTNPALCSLITSPVTGSSNAQRHS